MLVSFLFHVASGQRRPLGAWGTSASRGLRMVAAKRCGKDSVTQCAKGDQRGDGSDVRIVVTYFILYIYMTYAGGLGSLLSWRVRRPGDRQCARSSNLSRRWRLRQQCRHSTLGSAGSRVKPSTTPDQAQKVLRASADCATALLDLPLAPAPIDYQSPMDFKRSRDEAE